MLSRSLDFELNWFINLGWYNRIHDGILVWSRDKVSTGKPGRAIVWVVFTMHVVQKLAFWQLIDCTINSINAVWYFWFLNIWNFPWMIDQIKELLARVHLSSPTSWPHCYSFISRSTVITCRLKIKIRDWSQVAKLNEMECNMFGGWIALISCILMNMTAEKKPYKFLFIDTWRIWILK